MQATDWQDPSATPGERTRGNASATFCLCSNLFARGRRKKQEGRYRPDWKVQLGRSRCPAEPRSSSRGQFTHPTASPKPIHHLQLAGTVSEHKNSSFSAFRSCKRTLKTVEMSFSRKVNFPIDLLSEFKVIIFFFFAGGHTQWCSGATYSTLHPASFQKVLGGCYVMCRGRLQTGVGHVRGKCLNHLYYISIP